MLSSSKSANFSFGFGIALTIIGSILFIVRPDKIVMDKFLATQLSLENGSTMFELWKSTELEFHVFLFHVVNSKEVQEKGDVAILAERGPYVYDEIYERTIIRINDSADTIEYTAKRTLIFNSTKSGTLSDTDEITILNAAHLGSILMLKSMMPTLVPQFGNSIPLLFSDPSSIFMQARIKDILFEGIRIDCDVKSHKQLRLICNVLKTNRPPTIRNTQEGVYYFSFFNKINATEEGPFTIFRGRKDRYTAGYISKFKGLPYADAWNIKNCSIIEGTDGVFWPPMNDRKPIIFTYFTDVCRSLWAAYSHDEVYNGLLGYHYKSINSLWKSNDSACYCPRGEDGSISCLGRGLLDLTKCQEVPIIMSEPHFLHGDDSLSSITEGLNPVEDLHATCLTIEPLTGVPLSGFRRIQLNMMLEQAPVQLLANVTNGLFPLLWIEEGANLDQKFIEPVITLHRVRRILAFFIWLPFIFGIYYVIKFFWINH